MIIKVIGYANRLDGTQYYESIHDFLDFRTSEQKFDSYDLLLAHNFLTEEFVKFNGPKVFNMWEPLFTINEHNCFNVELDPYDPTMYLYNHPEIEKRMFYYSIQKDRRSLIEKLKLNLRKKRKKMCCLIHNFNLARDYVATDLIRFRFSFAMAMKKFIDIYSRNNWAELLYKYNEVKQYRELASRYKGSIENKLETLEKYNFTVCFENSNYNGYITEKLPQALMTGTVPLYWGGGRFLKESVPPDCYIDCSDKSPEKVSKIIKRMSFKKIIRYRKAAVRFLESDLADNFTKNRWAMHIAKRLVQQK